MTGLDFSSAIAAHFGLPTAQVDAFNIKMHHGVGEQLAVTLTIELTPADLQGIGLRAGEHVAADRRRVLRTAADLATGSNGIVSLASGAR